MRRDYLDPLPERVQQLASEIERAIGSEISVRPSQVGDRPLVGLAECSFGLENGAKRVFIVHAPLSCPDYVLTHEVLHLHRNVVLNVPALHAVVAHQEGGAHRINNDLEHLFVIPDEIALFPESIGRWQEIFEQAASELAEGRQSGRLSEVSFRAAALGLWMVASMTVPAWPGLDAISASLICARSEGAARAFVEQIRSKLPDKTAMIKAALEAQLLDKRCFSVGSFEGNQYFCRSIAD
jgi:hypothetical protein